MSVYSNQLIYGKNETERIVSVEPDVDSLVLFCQDNDGFTYTKTIPNKYWILTNRYLNAKQDELEGNQYYKYIRTYDSVEEKNAGRKILRKNNIDFYDIWDAKEASLVYNGITYFKGLKPKEVTALFFDIESTGLTHDGNSKVLLISNTFRKDGEITKKLFAYDDYATHGDMLEDWCSWVRTMDPTLLVGHNIFGYDLPYMRHCASLENVSLNLGRNGSELRFNDYTSKFRKDGSQDYEYFNASIYGREIVDTMFLSIKYDVSRRYTSYGLKSIIKEENLEKKDRVFYDAGEIRYKYKDPEEWKKIKSYAIDDADDAMSLFDLMAPSFFYFTQSVSKTFQQMINSATGSQINNIMVRAYLQDGHSVAKTEAAEPYPGAISFGVPGIYKNCFKQDVASLYPSIMREYKIYNKRKDPKGYFLEMVEHFTIERLKNKKLAKETGEVFYKDLQESQKIAINSMYGFLGATGLAYNYPAGADEITRRGREILSKAISFATGCDVDFWKNKAGIENET